MREDPAPPPGTTPESTTQRASPAPAYPQLPVRTATVIKAGIVGWALALMVTLVVPALHAGERSWWPWACVSGMTLGLIGYLYVRRGRGNASGVT